MVKPEQGLLFSSLRNQITHVVKTVSKSKSQNALREECQVLYA